MKYNEIQEDEVVHQYEGFEPKDYAEMEESFSQMKFDDGFVVMFVEWIDERTAALTLSNGISIRYVTFELHLAVFRLYHKKLYIFKIISPYLKSCH